MVNMFTEAVKQHTVQGCSSELQIGSRWGTLPVDCYYHWLNYHFVVFFSKIFTLLHNLRARWSVFQIHSMFNVIHPFSILISFCTQGCLVHWSLSVMSPCKGRVASTLPDYSSFKHGVLLENLVNFVEEL